MKFSKKDPETIVRVYPAGPNEYKMVVMEPKEVARFRLAGTKWVTDDGQMHKTHRDAMRHVARKLKAEHLLNAVKPARAQIPQTPSELKFANRDEAIRFVFNQDNFVDFLLKALDDYTKPIKREMIHASSNKTL